MNRHESKDEKESTAGIDIISAYDCISDLYRNTAYVGIFPVTAGGLQRYQGRIPDNTKAGYHC